MGVDPGGGLGALVAWLLGGLFFLVVAGLQNFAPPPPPADSVQRVEPFGQAGLVGRMAVRLNALLEDLDPAQAEQQMSIYLQLMQDSAYTPAEISAVPIVAHEIGGPERALEAVRWSRSALDALQGADEEAVDAAGADLDTQAELFVALRDEPGAYALTGPGLIPPDRRDALRDRLGVFGELIVAIDDGDRATLDDLRSGGAAIIVFGLVVGVLAIGVLLASVTCFVLALVWMRRWRARMAVPTPGGSVFLETWAAFVVGFLLVILLQGLLVALTGGAPGTEPAALMMQWLLLGVVFWPLLRGMAWGEFCRAVGLYRGRGVLREMGVGVFAYLAFLPCYVAAVLLTFVLILLWDLARASMGLPPGEPPSNPVLELIGQGDVLMIVALFLLATIWAPLVEELVFRGAMYRHLRARLGGATGVVLSALITGLLFAFMHGYGPLLTPPLIALALLFALLREWRGSLIAAITAHWLHNFTLIVLMLVGVSLLG